MWEPHPEVPAEGGPRRIAKAFVKTAAVARSFLSDSRHHLPVRSTKDGLRRVFGRVVVFAVVLSALAVAAPHLAPGLLRAALHPGSDANGESAAPGPAMPPAPLPPVRSASEDRSSFHRVALDANAEGHFVAGATINGGRVTVMVDTGATVVALSDATARRLGIFPAQSAYTQHMTTANGAVMAARVTLYEIRLGNVTLRDVAAVVVPGKALPVDLLGMSFLSRLSRFEIAGGQLVLSQ
jgi:aspartyl protease family protein